MPPYYINYIKVRKVFLLEIWLHMVVSYIFKGVSYKMILEIGTAVQETLEAIFQANARASWQRIFSIADAWVVVKKLYGTWRIVQVRTINFDGFLDVFISSAIWSCWPAIDGSWLLLLLLLYYWKTAHKYSCKIFIVLQGVDRVLCIIFSILIVA